MSAQDQTKYRGWGWVLACLFVLYFNLMSIVDFFLNTEHPSSACIFFFLPIIIKKKKSKQRLSKCWPVVHEHVQLRPSMAGSLSSLRWARLAATYLQLLEKARTPFTLYCSKEMSGTKCRRQTTAGSTSMQAGRKSRTPSRLLGGEKKGWVIQFCNLKEWFNPIINIT